MSILQQNIVPVFIIAGLTGSGKTALIQHLQRTGVQMLDIESMCRHDGSVFAKLQYPSQPSSYQFHKQLLKQWNQFDKNKPVFIESEIKKIGRITLPEWLFNMMSNAPVIWLNSEKRIRAERIASAIRKANPIEFCNCLEKFSVKSGQQNMEIALQHFVNGEIDDLVEILLTYYDHVAGYRYPLERVILNIDNTSNDFIKISDKIFTAIAFPAASEQIHN